MERINLVMLPIGCIFVAIAQIACLTLDKTAVDIPLVLIRYTISVLELDQFSIGSEKILLLTAIRIGYGFQLVVVIIGILSDITVVIHGFGNVISEVIKRSFPYGYRHRRCSWSSPTTCGCVSDCVFPPAPADGQRHRTRT